MISLRAPSYSPIALARVTMDFPAEQFTHAVSARASGSPHRSQIGGVIGRIDRQQLAHTQPDNGSSRRPLQTAQTGAKSAVTTPLAAALTLSGIRDLGLGIGAVTGVTRSRSGALPTTPPSRATFFLWDREAGFPCSTRD